ncbi:hypothetical protein K490DRAFT_65073 [Saccharata proteae CBS 121410]|uniref:Uncharacterized protein n=1 Tax=Saccharata proteae CBS 121410 TaxID=1314787 RepID=A0A9P4M0C9_9PEZI|nr:hypothetical protein K490DRAFT_65073 [Saccharata proteae CBS 121410]
MLSFMIAGLVFLTRLTSCSALPSPESASPFTTELGPITSVLDPAVPSNTLVSLPTAAKLELRQAVETTDAAAAAAAAVTAAAAGTAITSPTMSLSSTTQWVEVTLTDGSTTWTPRVAVMTFAAVPDQLETAGSGAIGLGTLTGEKESKATAALARAEVEGWSSAVLIAAGAAGLVGWIV